MQVRIRQGTEADLADVHRLVKELAAYVGSGAEVTATVEAYRADFADGFFRILVAEDEHSGRVIGMALYHFAYSTWKGRMIYLEDFVLDPACRRQGVGQKLWDALKDRGRAAGCKLLKWQIVAHNTEALKFYAAQDATIEENWLNGKLVLSS
jgi:GNAT superfamily N-acetyltransferase